MQVIVVVTFAFTDERDDMTSLYIMQIGQQNAFTLKRLQAMPLSLLFPC